MILNSFIFSHYQCMASIWGNSNKTALLLVDKITKMCTNQSSYFTSQKYFWTIAPVFVYPASLLTTSSDYLLKIFIKKVYCALCTEVCTSVIILLQLKNFSNFQVPRISIPIRKDKLLLIPTVKTKSADRAN